MSESPLSPAGMAPQPASPASALSPPLKWHGGKHYLAKRIIELMPPHIHYVEPYFGGGAVLLAKNPQGVSEVINDIDRELINFWSVLQNGDLFNWFKRKIEAVPFSEFEFDCARYESATAAQQGIEEAVDRAVRFFIKARQSRQALGIDFATLSRNRTRRGMNEQVSAWLTAIEGLPDVHARLKRVVMLDQDALEVIKSQDGVNTLFYLDPPYLHFTRESRRAYAYEMTNEQHEKLLETLAHIKGKFILSGYPSAMYDNAARMYGWHRVDIEVPLHSSSKSTKETKTESLWLNYPPPAK